MAKDWLSPGEHALLRDFAARLRAAAPGQVRRLVVFGSRARGASGPESDLDLALELFEGEGWYAVQQLASGLAEDAMLERGALGLRLAPVVVPPGGGGLAAALARDGLELEWQPE